MRINFNNTNYKVIGKAYTVNGGEYFICVETDSDNEKMYLIPTDSNEVIMF